MEFIDLKAQYRELKDKVDARIQNVLDHGQYIMGPEVAELEERLADYVDVEHCIGVASGTDALLISMMALGIKAGDEVITTPFTFIATGEMISLIGAVPVFIDVDPLTYNINPELIEAAITSNTRAIMPVSLYGQCADLEAINAISSKYDIPVIEDGAQSFGATRNGKRSCGMSTIGCTSFFPSKPLGCYGDGGACFTNDEGLAKAMREIRVHGQNRRYNHPIIGINGRLDTIQAAILLAKFDSFQTEVLMRAEIASRYDELIGSLSNEVTTPYIDKSNTSVYAQYTVQIPERDAVQSDLREKGIPTAVHYPIPLNSQPAFNYLNTDRAELRIAHELATRVLSLPMHPLLSISDQDRVVEVLVDSVNARAKPK